MAHHYVNWRKLDDDGDPGAWTTSTWQELAMVLARRGRLVGRLTAAAAFFIFLLLLLRPPVYTAVATLELKPRVVETPMSAESDTAAIAARGTDYRHIEADINSAVTMLASPTLVRAALERASASRAPVDDGGILIDTLRTGVAALRSVLALPKRLHDRIHGVEPASAVDQMVGETLRDLTVMPVEASRLIQVSFRSNDPGWSADVANELTTVLLDPAVRNQAAHDSLRFVRRQRELLEGRFLEAQAELRTFRRHEGDDFALSNEQELRSMRVGLETSKATTDAELAEVSAGLDALEREIASLPKTFPLSAQVEQTQPIQSLITQLATLEVERSQLAAVYAPESQAMRDVNDRIRTLKSVLARERGAAASRFRAGGAEIQGLRMQALTARTKKAELEARAAALATQLQRNTELLDRVDELSAENRRLETRLATAQETYFTYLKKEEEARFAAAVDDSAITNIVVASPAAVPAAPDPSAQGILLLLGVLLSFCTATGLAYVVDRLDPSLKSAEDVVEAAPYPVLVSYVLDGRAAPAPLPYDHGEKAGGVRRIASP